MAEEFTPIETQEAFETAIAERIEQARQEERDKFSDYEDLKAQLSAANETNTTQAEKIKQLEADALKRRIADEAGLPPAMASRLAGESEDDLREDAISLTKLLQRDVLPLRDPEAPEPDGVVSAFQKLNPNIKI